jgi:large subunit ribosomal protein L17
MELANFWLLEKQLVHKLFKVLVPRFQNYNTAVTRCLPIQRSYPAKGWDQFEKSLLELKGKFSPSAQLK